MGDFRGLTFAAGTIERRLAHVQSRPCRLTLFAADSDQYEERGETQAGLVLQLEIAERRRQEADRDWRVLRSHPDRRRRRDVPACRQPDCGPGSGNRERDLELSAEGRYTFETRRDLLARRQRYSAANRLYHRPDDGGPECKDRPDRAGIRQRGNCRLSRAL